MKRVDCIGNDGLRKKPICIDKHLQFTISKEFFEKGNICFGDMQNNRTMTYAYESFIKIIQGFVRWDWSQAEKYPMNHKWYLTYWKQRE